MTSHDDKHSFDSLIQLLLRKDGEVGSSYSEIDYRKIQEVSPVMGPKDMNENDHIIVIMGPTGAGKSTLIETVTHDWYDAGEVGHTLQSTTSNVSALRIKFPDNNNVVLVDTPGFDDTNRSDLDILKTIADWFKTIPSMNGEVSGIVYLHRITDPRMTKTVVKNFDMFQRLCGRNFYPRVVLATTMWPEGTEDEWLTPGQDEFSQQLFDRERDLENNYWGPMIRQGSSHFRFTGTQDSAWRIFNHIICTQARARSAVLVRIQTELIKQGKDVARTDAGKHLHGLLQGLVARQGGVIEQLKSEVLKSAGQDQAVIDALLDELGRLSEEREQNMKGVDALDSSPLRSIKKLFSKKSYARGKAEGEGVRSPNADSRSICSSTDRSVVAPEPPRKSASLPTLKSSFDRKRGRI